MLANLSTAFFPARARDFVNVRRLQFQAIGEDPEKFKAFVSMVAARKNRARASSPALRMKTNKTKSMNPVPSLSSHEVARDDS